MRGRLAAPGGFAILSIRGETRIIETLFGTRASGGYVVRHSCFGGLPSLSRFRGDLRQIAERVAYDGPLLATECSPVLIYRPRDPGAGLEF